MNEIIKLKNISYAYSNTRDALTDINLTINKGEDISIIGHNGSGKSTLAKLIAALLKPKSGNLYFNNVEINNKNTNLIRDKVGMVFQNPDNQFIGITVADDIAFGLENRRIPRDKMSQIIEEYSKKTGIYELLNKEPATLSGGQKQRVAITGILAMSPEVIIFDEALAMLDPRGKNEILKLIKDIKKNNSDITIIRITHDLDEAFYSDRIIVLSEGKIVNDNTPTEVFKEEDKLIKLGLDLPFIVKLNKELLKEGLIDKAIYDFDLLIEKLCK